MTARVAIVASHVIQYQDPFFRLLAAIPGVALDVDLHRRSVRQLPDERRISARRAVIQHPQLVLGVLQHPQLLLR